MRTKLLLSFMAVILLPLLTLGILGPLISARTLESETTAHTVQLIRQVTVNIEFYIRQMEALISVVSEEPNVRAFLEGDERRRPEGLGFLQTLCAAHPQIAGLLVANESDKLLSTQVQRITRDPLPEERWYRKAVEDPGRVQLFSRPIGRNLRNVLEYSADDVVSIVKAVIDARSGRCLGVVLVDMKLQVVEDIFVDMKLGEGGFLYIQDSEGGIVYAPVNPVVYRMRNEWLTSPRTSIVRQIGGSDYQIVFQDSDYTGWKTVGVFPLSETLQPVSNILYYSLVIAGGTVVVAFLVSVFASSSIARPLIKLQALMKEAEEGNLSVRFEGREDDEISRLGKSFNTMIEEIQKLIDMVYREQHSKREAELKTLQEQIKPHFLYNTLDTIQWMAQEHGAEDIVRIVSALTSLFRIGLSKGKEMICVAEELEHVRSYLTIQKARYEDKFDFEVAVEDSVLPLMVLKLTLQPLVENAIYHGIKERRGHGHIRVEAARRDGMLVMRVCDDGAGMNEAQLAEIRGLLDGKGEQRPRGGGYGIFNVNERIRLSFGNEFGLRFASAPEQGTVVEVLHPLISSEESEDVEGPDRG